MAIESNFTIAVRSQANEVLVASKNAKYGTPWDSILRIEIGRGTINTLTDLCGQVDARARKGIEAMLKKAEKKFGFAQRVTEYKLGGDKVKSDPRVEKMVDKLTQIKQNPLPEQEKEHQHISEKLFKWHRKLDRIFKEDGLTNELNLKAYALIYQLEQQSSQSSKQPLVSLVPNPSPLFPEAPFKEHIDSVSEKIMDHYATSVDIPENVQNLIEIIKALSERSEEGFYKASKSIEKVKDAKFTFSMSGGEERSILDRIHFHLYQIQDQDTPDKIDRSDRNWGLTAFQTEGTSTSHQKLRAVQRVLLEMLLGYVKESIEDSKDGEISKFYTILIKMNLDRKDLPQGINNVGNDLAVKLYQMTHAKSPEKNSDLREMRLEFLGEFLQELKTTWRIPPTIQVV